jgi:hypothetical protein
MTPLTDWPSVVSVIKPLLTPVAVAGDVAVADITPDKLSPVWNGTTTAVLYQPEALETVGDALNVSVGTAVSTTNCDAMLAGGTAAAVAEARTSAAALT